jgi:hypothetical protein
VEHNTGDAPQQVLADNGYLSEDDLARLRARGQRCLVATGRESRKARRWPLGRETQRVHRILRLPWARRLYAHRKTQGERPFAEIEPTMGLRRFQLRGLARVVQGGTWCRPHRTC